jgi:hypothetical protein
VDLHGLKNNQARFVKYVLPSARKKTAPYVIEWKAKQPKRRKWGTTTQQVLAAIRDGYSTPKQIAVFARLNASTVRSHLKRLVDAGTLLRSDDGFIIAGDVLHAVA